MVKTEWRGRPRALTDEQEQRARAAADRAQTISEGLGVPFDRAKFEARARAWQVEVECVPQWSARAGL